MQAFTSPLIGLLLMAGLTSAVALAGHAVAPSDGAPANRIGHVFVLVLENKGFEASFGPNATPGYLGRTLPAQGRLLTNYYGTGHASLDNYISMVSGQAPNPQTQGDCFVYTDFVMTAMVDGQAVGDGCVYPAQVETVFDQLEASHRTWRQYAEDMAASPGTAPTACRHPPLDARDEWQVATPTDQYATRHVGPLYFHSIIDEAASCQAHVVDLDLLRTDLQHAKTTPDVVFITPDLCSDGHDAPCADGRPGGYGSIDAFLETWVPRILESPAYKKDGLLVITFDESDTSDASACCDEKPGFNTALPGLWGPGGGRTGAVLLARCLPAGTVDDTPYNHYGLLRTIEDLYGLAQLGYAAQDGLHALDLTDCDGHR